MTLNSQGNTMQPTQITVNSGNTKVHYVFHKPNGKVNLKKIDSVLTKKKEDFKKYSVQDWGDLMYGKSKIQTILKTAFANNVAKSDPNFDPALMGKAGYTKMGELFYDEEWQRLMEEGNTERILAGFNIRYFTCVLCVILEDKTTGEKIEKYSSTIDGWHHLVALYLHLRAGNIKGWDPEDWKDFPVPTQTWETDDPTLSGRLSLLVNGEGQQKWGEFEYMRIHSNNFRFYPERATEEDKLAYEQVQACIKEGNSMPISKHDKDNLKKDGVLTHIDAIRQNKNTDISRLKFIMKTNNDWWPLEKRSSAMFGLYGNIYDEFVRTSKSMKGQAFDDQILAYHYIIQHVFGNLDNALKALSGKHGALKKLEALTKSGWKAPSTDNALLAVVEILYKDYLQGPEKISAARGSFTYVTKKGTTINIVDALAALPNTNYANLIDSL
jgi:hypothetical protein